MLFDIYSIQSYLLSFFPTDLMQIPFHTFTHCSQYPTFCAQTCCKKHTAWYSGHALPPPLYFWKSLSHTKHLYCLLKKVLLLLQSKLYSRRVSSFEPGTTKNMPCIAICYVVGYLHKSSYHLLSLYCITFAWSVV